MCMCMCVCVHVCVCMYVCMSACVYECMCMCACVSVCVSTCVYVCMGMCVCVSVCVSVCVYVHVWLCVCVWEVCVLKAWEDETLVPNKSTLLNKTEMVGFSLSRSSMAWIWPWPRSGDYHNLGSGIAAFQAVYLGQSKAAYSDENITFMTPKHWIRSYISNFDK